jgi:tricarballylate dehydrogenase
VAGGGVGQLTQWRAIAEALGIEIRFDSPVCAILGDLRRVEGVSVSGPQRRYDLVAKAVIACAGGFQANPEMRARYLAGNTDLMKVRGSRHDTGEVLRLLIELGARGAGHWQSGHMSPVDANAPDFETLQHADGRGNTQSRYDYPFGITVNALGLRFFDEGEAQHSYTYAKTGRAVLAQPGGTAYQIYDQRGIQCFRYPHHQATFVEAATIAELAPAIGIEPKVLAHTVEEFNRAVVDERPFDPRKPDGRSTRGLAIPKSNWACRIDTPPFRAYPVTGGITFTFGGVAIDRNAQVINTIDQPIKGLYASGDIVGLFFHNYPSFTGQTRNAVFGRLAGHAAAAA